MQRSRLSAASRNGHGSASLWIVLGLSLLIPFSVEAAYADVAPEARRGAGDLAARPAPRRGTLEEILARNAEARGGRARFDALRALRLALVIEEPAFAVTGTYVATADGYMRVDIYRDGQHVFSEALGPGGGWQWRGGDHPATPITAEGEAALHRGLVSNLYALYQWPQNGYRLTLADAAGSNTDAAPPGPVILVDEANGFTRRLWIDAQTGLVARAWEHSALHPDIDARRTDQYSATREWLTVRGLLLPRVIEKVEAHSGAVIQHSEVEAAELVFAGEAVPGWALAAYFERPGDR